MLPLNTEYGPGRGDLATRFGLRFASWNSRL